MIGLDLLGVSVLTGPWLNGPHGRHNPLDFVPIAFLVGADQKIYDQFILKHVGLAPCKPLEHSDSSPCCGLHLILPQKLVSSNSAYIPGPPK